jgi:hypothetical protein
MRPSIAAENGCGNDSTCAINASGSIDPPTWLVPERRTVKLSPPPLESSRGAILACWRA